jgi:restriction system protein
MVAALKGRGGSASIEEIEADVAAILNLSEEARAIPHKTGRRTQFQYDLAWVRTYLKFGGAADNSARGIWHLTPLGWSLSDDEARGLWRRLVAERRKQKRSERDAEDPEETAEGEISAELHRSWKDHLLAVLQNMDPAAFERLSQRLLRESGFIKVEVTGRSGDGGIDGVGVLRLNLLSFQVLFQCKRWRSTVPSSVIRDFRGAMIGRADKGLIITTATFTSDARREATRDGAPVIDLVDGDTLCDLLKSTRIGVKVTTVEQVEVDETAIASV